MEKEAIELITTQLDKIAAKLGTTVEQIWPWLVKQQYVDALWSLGLITIFSIIGYRSYCFVKKVTWRIDGCTIKQVVGIALGVLSTIGLMASFIHFLDRFPNIFNPKYWALRDLFEMIK